MRKALALLALLPALALAGCASSSAPAPSDAPSTPAVESPTPEPSESASPDPDEPATPAPEEPGTPAPDEPAPPAAGGITPQVAYDLCIQQIGQGGYLAEGDPANVTYAPFAEAVSVTRDDGYIGIYIEVTDGNNANQPESALECIVRGSAQNPDWYSYGIGSRAESREQIEADLRAEHSA